MSPFVQLVLIGMLIALAIITAAALMAQRIPATSWLRPTSLVGASVLATWMAGWYAAGALGFSGDETPACDGVIDPARDAAQLALAVTCGNGMTFEEVSHAAYDVQFLDIEVAGRAAPGGPLAAIYPEVNTHRNHPSTLAAGRIVAKVWVDPADSMNGYPKLGLGPGINYIWIDANSPPQGEAPAFDLARFPRDTIAGLRLLPDTTRGVQVVRGRYRAVAIPTAPGFAAQVLPVTYYDHSRADISTRRNQPLARWIFRPNDIGEWMDCTKYGCCDVGN